MSAHSPCALGLCPRAGVRRRVSEGARPEVHCMEPQTVSRKRIGQEHSRVVLPIARCPVAHLARHATPFAASQRSARSLTCGSTRATARGKKRGYSRQRSRWPIASRGGSRVLPELRVAAVLGANYRGAKPESQDGTTPKVHECGGGEAMQLDWRSDTQIGGSRES